MKAMVTSINGQPAEWSREIWQKWYDHVETNKSPRLYDSHGVVSEANYFTPRPYVDQYNQGDLKEGFTFTVGSFLSGYKVYQVVINGYMPFLTREP